MPEFKSFISFLTLSLAITSIAVAQKSVSATMKVQVRVVEGNAITQQAGDHVIDLSEMASGPGISELTSMQFSNAPGYQIALEHPEMLRLQNRRGEELLVPIIYEEYGSASGNVLKIKAGWNLDDKLTKQKQKQVFEGELLTSVAYQ